MPLRPVAPIVGAYAAVTLCFPFLAVGQSAMPVWQTRYEIQAGQTVSISAPQETLSFLAKAKTRKVQMTAASTTTGALAAGPNRAGDQILLGASLRAEPGEYTVNLSATSATGEVR